MHSKVDPYGSPWPIYNKNNILTITLCFDILSFNTNAFVPTIFQYFNIVMEEPTFSNHSFTTDINFLPLKMFQFWEQLYLLGAKSSQ